MGKTTYMYIMWKTCRCAYLSPILPVYLNACLSNWMLICQPICLPACQLSCLPVCLLECMSVCLPTWGPTSLPASPSACLSTYLHTCLPFGMPVCLFAYMRSYRLTAYMPASRSRLTIYLKMFGPVVTPWLHMCQKHHPLVSEVTENRKCLIRDASFWGPCVVPGEYIINIMSKERGQITKTVSNGPRNPYIYLNLILCCKGFRKHNGLVKNTWTHVKKEKTW